MMHILISGSNGFLGKNLVERLLKEPRIKLTVINSKLSKSLYPLSKVRKLDIDLLKINELMHKFPEDELIKYDACIHLAWHGIPVFSEANNEKNRILAINMYKLARMLKINNMLFAGSCSEYGNLSGKVSEETKGRELNKLGSTKELIRKDLNKLNKNNDAIIKWMRIFYVYGPGQRDGSLIPSLLKEGIRNGLVKPNNPYNICDFIYINDVVEAMLKLINVKVGGVFNIGSGVPICVSDLAEYIVNILELKEHLLHSKSSKKDSLGLYADISKIQLYSGWEPNYSIMQGIKLMLGDLQKNSIGKKHG